jgi:hypothetical protein
MRVQKIIDQMKRRGIVPPWFVDWYQSLEDIFEGDSFYRNYVYCESQHKKVYIYMYIV